MLAKPIMVIITQYIQTWNHYAVHQKLMCYMPIISQSLKKKKKSGVSKHANGRTSGLNNIYAINTHTHTHTAYSQF